MGTYIGAVSRVTSGWLGERPKDFINVRPVVALDGENTHTLSETEIEELLPESKRGDLNYRYQWGNDALYDVITELFPEHGLVVIEFEPEDLKDNINERTGLRFGTGYFVGAWDMLQSGKIRKLDEEDIFYALDGTTVNIDQFMTETVADVNSKADRLRDAKVLIQTGGFWAGPRKVQYNSTVDRLEVSSDARTSGYMLAGYWPENVIPLWVDVNGEPVRLLVPKKKEQDHKDIASDKDLINGIRQIMDKHGDADGGLLSEDLRTLLESTENKVFGPHIPAEVRKERIERVQSMLEIARDNEKKLGELADIVAPLALRYSSNDALSAIFDAYIKSNPEWIHAMSETASVAEKVKELQRKKDELEQEIAQMESDSGQAAVDAEAQSRFEEERAKMTAENEELKKELAKYDGIRDIEKRLAQTKDELYRTEIRNEDALKHMNELEAAKTEVESSFLDLIRSKHEKMMEVTYDGFLANKISESAAQWKKDESVQQRERVSAVFDSIETASLSPAELREYLVTAVQKVRPKYDETAILNIAICMTQGFVTVFSGESGSGKTSISNIFAEVLGLNKMQEFAGTDVRAEALGRYLPISVGRGWSSKSDLLGYYNPLTKTFDQSNKRFYDALQLLDDEVRKNNSRFPYLVLLDEANLSQMEYYWSDFMNVCDAVPGTGEINLGEDFIFGVPETLRFFATINNDDTTTPLSPRLIDRSWIISLPSVYGDSLVGDDVPPELVRIVSWSDLNRAFGVPTEAVKMSDETRTTYEGVLDRFKRCGINVSARADRAIRGYWGAAALNFPKEEDASTDPQTAALDYAVSQRLLPKILGNGDKFEEQLKNLRKFSGERGLRLTSVRLDDILERGNNRMKYYSFF